MAQENIYIGNRYVVRYMGNWDSAVQYESLSAVLYGGNAYVSNKPVPAGTLPTDTDYWAFWGSGNAVIDALSIRVNALESQTTDLTTRVTKNEGDILDLTTRLGLVESDVDQLEFNVSANTSAISSLVPDVESLKSLVATMQTDLAGTERTINKNRNSGYQGINSSGYAVMPTLRATPVIMTARLSAAHTISDTLEHVPFDTIVDYEPKSGITIALEDNGNFVIDGYSSSGYDVFVACSVLCVPNGGTGTRSIFIAKNQMYQYASEGFYASASARAAMAIPEVYIGTVNNNVPIRIVTSNWRTGDQVGLGSIVGNNYGSSWVCIKVYPRSS